MKVLVISQLYVPEPDEKVHSLASALKEMGHAVTSITGFPNYPTGRIYLGYRQHLWQWEMRDGVKVLRVPIIPDHSLSAMRRAFHYSSFALAASLLGLLLVDRPDVIWVRHPPLTVALPAAAIARKHRIPFVYDIQDLWPETLLTTGIVHQGLLTQVVDVAARRVYKAAHSLTVNSKGFRSNLIDKGVPGEKIHVLHNWADERMYYPVPYDQSMAKKLGLDGAFNVMFAGNLGTAQGLDTLIDAAIRLATTPQVQLVLVGSGVEEDRLKKRIGRLRLSNVKFLGKYPSDMMAKVFGLADALVIHLKDLPLFGITIPTKTQSYLAVGKPILAALGGEAADIIHESGAGVTCPPGNPRAMAEQIRYLQSLNSGQLRYMGTAGRRYYEEHFTRQGQVAKYEAVLARAVIENERGVSNA